MIRKSFLLIIAVLVIGSVMFIFNRRDSAFSENSVSPILDLSVDSSLQLNQCYAVEQIPAYATSVEEFWSSSAGELIIQRWDFYSVKKMDDFFDPSSKLLVPAILCWQKPLIWNKEPDISDKTCWGSYCAVLFIKGKHLVRISLNSRIGMNDEQKKEYTRKIAQSIAKKL